MAYIAHNEECPECGKITDVLYISDDVRMCEECADLWGFEYCDICEEYYAGIEFTDLPDGRHVCEWCMEDREEWDDS